MKSNQTVTTQTSGQDWKEFLRNWSFPCPACGQIGILRTDTESWYICRHCGHVFNLEQASSIEQASTRGGDGRTKRVKPEIGSAYV